MILFQVEGIQKHYGPEPVLDGVTFDVRPGERIGLVGPNGTGKTTLMRILAEKEEADGGSIIRHPSLHVGYLEQQPEWEPGRTLLDEAKSALAGLMAMQEELISVAEEMGHCGDPLEHKRLADRYDHLQHEMQSRDAYNLDHKIERVLDGLRFRRETFNQPVESLSGGEQNRLMLAKLLLAEPNVMLLDEPSNHLDIEATEWLESFLAESAAAMLLVSHDRYFLDHVTNRTLELFQGTVDSYTGNFSAYWQQKAERLLVQQRTFEKQQIEIEKAKDFIRRNHYGQKHQQAEDRRKKLDRIELVALPRAIILPPMGFPPASRSGDIVVRAQRLTKAFARPLFADVDLQINRAERLGLLGPNGCGKSTLLRCLLGEERPDAGAVQLGTGVSIGYFDQHLSGVADDDDVLDSIRPKHKQFLTQQRRDLLARFGITGDTALQKVGKLSGGERNRVALARLAAADANFLVLDEPTNHLDLWARDALEQALAAFDGTVLFVSHDRYFVNRVADHLIVFEPSGVRVIEGNYEEYQLFLQSKAAAVRSKAQQAAPRGKSPAAEKSHSNRHSKSRVREAPKHSSGKSGPAPSMKEERGGKNGIGDTGTAQRSKKRRFPYRKLSDIEGEIFQRESRIEQLNEELGDQATFRDGGRIRALKQELAEQQSALKKLYEHWEEASEMNW
ncbi:MAG: ABC-F family ATP-binding cassette domain-containing protein [Thermoguttaceae bacterium]